MIELKADKYIEFDMVEGVKTLLARDVQTLTNGFMKMWVTIKGGVLSQVEVKSTFF